jgi:hypothetical protein
VNFTTLNNAGALNNVTGLLSSGGMFTNAGSGVFTNSGTFNNSGNFQNQSGGVVQGAGVFVSSGGVQTIGNFSQNDVQVAESVFTQNASATVTLGSLEVGTVAQSSATYQLSGGVLYASTEIIGQAGGAIYGCDASAHCNDFGSTPGATGSLTQVAGANTVAGSLVVGASAGATGVYQLAGGATLTAGQEIVGQQGSISEFECALGCGVTLSGGAGTFTQSGTSTNTVGTLTISANQGNRVERRLRPARRRPQCDNHQRQSGGSVQPIRWIGDGHRKHIQLGIRYDRGEYVHHAGRFHEQRPGHDWLGRHIERWHVHPDGRLDPDE